jgi:hypothetical protein
MSVKESAERLRRLMIEKCPPLEARFNPGLSPEECKALAAQYDVVLTQELIDFFGVINGFDDIYDTPVNFYSGRYFDTLSESLKHYKEFWYYNSDKNYFLERNNDLSDINPAYFDDTNHKYPLLCFMRDDSCYFYAADLEGEGMPVWSHAKAEGLELEKFTLQEFLGNIYTELESGKIVYNKESNEWEDDIWRKSKLFWSLFNSRG